MQAKSAPQVSSRAPGTPDGTISVPSFLWLEITGRCPAECAHCYAGSGPAGSHGAMTPNDWESTIAQAVALGVSMVQFIGGEPTAHPQFAALLRYAIDCGLAVEVYTNLICIKDIWWELFSCPNVSLATSWYSDTPAEHDAITRRRGSYARTRANIAEAVRRGIPLRAGIIGVSDAQRVDQARAELETIGVTSIGTDHLRQVGRGALTRQDTRGADPDASQLCGHCGQGVAAILPSGDVCPCVFSRWLIAGNVLQAPLADILGSRAMTDLVAGIASALAVGHDHDRAGQPSACRPHACEPARPCNPHGSDGCEPKSCQPALNPCKPRK